MPNPADRGGLRPVELITDRAKRYRAHNNPPPGQHCVYCGSAQIIDIDHIDGDEGNNDATNLVWSCRSCNTTKGAWFAKRRLGRKTRQYNPATAVASIKEWKHVSNVLTGRDPKGPTEGAIRAAMATPPAQRARYAAQMHRNPSPTFAQYAAAVAEQSHSGKHGDAGKLIHATPPQLRTQYAERIAEIKRRRGTDRYSPVPF